MRFSAEPRDLGLTLFLHLHLLSNHRQHSSGCSILAAFLWLGWDPRTQPPAFSFSESPQFKNHHLDRSASHRSERILRRPLHFSQEVVVLSEAFFRSVVACVLVLADT